MKSTLTHPHTANLHITLTPTARRWFYASCSVLIPYALAAIGVFVYHGQWLK